MSEVDDAGLLDRARKGDEAAFAELFGRHQRAIYRYAVHMCGADAGDDIVQETFLAVLQQRGRNDTPRGPMAGYLIGIARHRIWKRLSASGLAMTPLDDEVMAEGASEDQLSALEALTRAETVAAVRDAVRSLPPAYREVVVLCDLEELNYTAAAEVMACPVGTVRSRLHRARALPAARLSVMPAIEPAGTRGAMNDRATTRSWTRPRPRLRRRSRSIPRDHRRRQGGEARKCVAKLHRVNGAAGLQTGRVRADLKVGPSIA
jgi:RNA polymerase sigma-70 factor (ECF subfamily)